MDRAKIFTAFIFLSAFAFQVSTQDKKPKIVWKNLQEKYERFEDIQPTIVNTQLNPIYFYPDISLFHLNKSTNQWKECLGRFVCYTSVGQIKLKYKKEFSFGYSKDTWNEIIYGDFGDSPCLEKDSRGSSEKYKLRFSYALKRTGATEAMSEFSSEFEVVERDFEK